MSMYSSNGRYSSKKPEERNQPQRSRQNSRNPQPEERVRREYPNYEAQRPYAQPQPDRRRTPPKKKRKKSFGIVYALLIVVLILSSLMLLYTLRRVAVIRQETKAMENRSEQVHAIEQQHPEQAGRQEKPVVPAAQSAEELPSVYSNFIAYREPGDLEYMLPQYTQLYAENNDMFGWLKIDDTRIDYPVMYSPEDPEKYLHSDFSGRTAFSGTPFLDGACSFDSDQLLIYAHNMKNGTMFHDLYKYENQEFWEAHPVIYFDTLYEQYRFEVMAVLYDKVYYKTDDCFKFYQFTDAADQTDYENAVAYYKSHALYDTGVTAQYGDQLLALVTCAYQTDDGRFVVIARKVND